MIKNIQRALVNSFCECKGTLSPEMVQWIADVSPFIQGYAEGNYQLVDVRRMARAYAIKHAVPLSAEGIAVVVACSFEGMKNETVRVRVRLVHAEVEFLGRPENATG